MNVSNQCAFSFDYDAPMRWCHHINHGSTLCSCVFVETSLQECPEVCFHDGSKLNEVHKIKNWQVVGNAKIYD